VRSCAGLLPSPGSITVIPMQGASSHADMVACMYAQNKTPDDSSLFLTCYLPSCLPTCLHVCLPGAP
jgi:hypothetical protein